MKAIAENLCRRGKKGVYYCRRRVPHDLLPLYGRAEILRSLKTADESIARQRWREVMVGLDREFSDRRQQLAAMLEPSEPITVPLLTDQFVENLGRYWVQQVLSFDDTVRLAGLDDGQFDELGEKLSGQRKELGRILAQGRFSKIEPAFFAFLHLCGVNAKPSHAERPKVLRAFLKSVIAALDVQLERHDGKVRETHDVVEPGLVEPPAQLLQKQAIETTAGYVAWDQVFDAWEHYVENRPKSTVFAYQTPWRELKRFAASKGISGPCSLTSVLMTEFVQHMHMDCKLQIGTINERLAKLKGIFKVAVGRHLLIANPAADTLGFKESVRGKETKKRLPFAPDELEKLFGCPIYTDEQLRSQGQAGEASYWIPLLMFYTGARTEEVAGLQLQDIRLDPQHGWYFDITDLFSSEDDLFDESERGHEGKRGLKNAVSRRKIPVAKPLIALGLLEYRQHLLAAGECMLFPTLKHDSHDKLGGAFGKWFGRHKRKLGITSDKKVLYSFRHNMKTLLEQAQMPSKYLKRILGHASGDGSITDSYGDGDVPLAVIVEWFGKVQFPELSVKRWRPGCGVLRADDYKLHAA
ncbi:integrase [Aquitalea sp. S1-19]|nr:integrase [Aquitalea sp. S1-19]